jgi:chloride channel 3/4/5
VEIGSTSIIEFGPWVDQTPITVHPKQALEVVLDLFKNMGQVNAIFHCF